MMAAARRWARSSHARFIGLILLLELLFGGLLLLSVTRLVENRINQSDSIVAASLRDDLLAVADDQGVPGLSRVIAKRIAGRSDELILLADADGRAIAGNLERWPPTIAAPSRWTKIDLYRVGGDRPGRFGVVAERLSGGERLLAGHLIEGSAQFTRTVEDALLTALLMALPLAAAGAWFVVYMIDRRIAGVTATAQGVRAGDFGRRVVLDGSGDSFDQLGGTINTMLDRIEALMSEMRLLTDSMAHDLRSPLTRLRTRVDRAALSDDREALQGAIEGIGKEADQLLAMLGTTLEISRAEAGIGRERFVDADLPVMLADLVELYEPVAEDTGREISLQVEAGMHLPVHRELLGQAVSNLIDNALKYGTGGIKVRLSEHQGDAVIAVSDQGPGIAPDRQQEALRRFGRLDPARSTSGAGLGLSLVSAVAQLHGGKVALTNGEGEAAGFSAEMRLPKGERS
ncbi:MAG: sensor histidine kinase [Sphingobium phenoxybenzoativorans]